MFNYYINNNGALEIYVNNMIVAEISDCAYMNDYEIERLIKEVIECI